MHEQDNVAIVANQGGLPAGTVLPTGQILQDRVPQGHKVALVHLPLGSAVRRYSVTIGHTLKDLPAGSWVNEAVLQMPAARSLGDLPMATRTAPVLPALDGYTFEGYRNADGSVGTRNILAITTTVQCVAGVLDFAIQRIKAELCPKYPNVDDVVGLEHSYGCGVAIDAPDAIIPIRTLRNISLNPNFGGEVMVVSLGCEKLQPERLLPPGSIAINSVAINADKTSASGSFDSKNTPSEPNQPCGEADPLDVVCLQAENHVGFMSMVDAILVSADKHLARLNARQRETVPASALVVGVQCGGTGAHQQVAAKTHRRVGGDT